MFFLVDYNKQYPKFGNYITTAVRQVRNQPKVWSALLAAAGTNQHSGKYLDNFMSKMAEIYLLSGTPPQLISAELPEDECAAFSPKLPHAIIINHLLLVHYENDSPNEKADKFMLATVLHEFVHFLDFNRDGKLLDECIKEGQNTGIKDRGDIFEEKAYGGKVPFWK